MVHISEEEAAKDFGALMERARKGERIQVERPGRPGVLIASENAVVKQRTIAEALEILRLREESHGLAVPDSDFAADMEEIHALHNLPMDMSRWN